MKIERKSNIQNEMNHNSNISNVKQKLKKKNLIVTTEKYKYVDLILYDKKGKLVWFRKQGILLDRKC